MIDERESVAEGFELLPHSDLLGGFEVIQSTGVDGCEEFGEVVVEVVEDLIGRRALLARRCWWLPELHTSIVFEDAFDDKLFSQQYKEKRDQELAPDRQANPLNEPLCTHSPSCSRHCLKRAARSWGQGWPGACEGPPGGLGLDASEDGATLEKPGAGAADRYQCPSTSSGHRAIDCPSTSSGHIDKLGHLLCALRQAQGTLVSVPFDKLRAQALIALRQAQGTFDKLRARFKPRSSPSRSTPAVRPQDPE